MHRVLVLGATSDSTLPACSYEWKPAAGFISVHRLRFWGTHWQQDWAGSDTHKRHGRTRGTRI
jgi:hypothetical protein